MKEIYAICLDLSTTENGGSRFLRNFCLSIKPQIVIPKNIYVHENVHSVEEH
jgi:hypothetical protein